MSTPASSSRGLVLTVSALVMFAGTELLTRPPLSVAVARIAPVVRFSVLCAVPWAAVVLRMASIAVQTLLEPCRGFTAGYGSLLTGIAIAVSVGGIVRLRMARDRAVRSVQRGVLQPPGRIGDLSVAIRCASAAGFGRDRGVLCEVMETPFGVRVVMGDVRGSGRLEAVQVIARALGEIREAAQYEPSLAGVAARAEACVSGPVAAGVLVTAVFAEFSGAEVVLLSCGHAPVPLVAYGDGVRPAACEAGPPVGLAELAPGEPLLRQEPFVAGQTLVLCSDGVAEARGCGGARYPLEERMARLAMTAGWRAVGVEERAESLVSDLIAFAGDELDNDAVVFLVERVRPADG